MTARGQRPMPDAELELTAPVEGTASTPGAIADELSEVLCVFERVDYNALTTDELEELFDARATVFELCSRYRNQQRGHSGVRDRATMATDGGGDV